MSNFTADRGTFLRIGAALLCILPRVIFAEGEAAPLSSSDSNGGAATVSSSESNGGSGNNLGPGIFTRFPIQVSAYVRGGYDDNINTTHFAQQDSWFTAAGLALAYDFGSPRTKLTLSTNTGLVYYFDSADNQYEPSLNLTLQLTHKASPRLSFRVTSYISYQTEPDFNYALGTNRRAGNYFSTQDSLSAAYAWTPRFSTNTSYTFSAVHYDDSAFGFFEDRLENRFGNEFRFLLLPETNLVVEYRFEIVSYEHISRDSTTHFFLGGIDHIFNSRLSGSFRGGLELRDYQDIGQKDSPYFESTLSYVLGKNTSASWTNHYEIQEGDVTLNPTRTTFRTGLQAKHNITSRVAGTFGMYYAHDEYDSALVGTSVNPGFSEDSFNLSLSLRYAVTRYLGVEAGYDYVDVSSGEVFREYSRNRVWGGFSVAF